MNKEEINNQIAADINPEQIGEAKNNIAEDPGAVELPMLPNGKIDAAVLSGGKVDGKGRFILPKEIIEEHHKLLPDGCISEDGSVWTSCGGILRMLTEEAQRKGREAFKSTQSQRRTFKEVIDIMLKSQANDRELAEVGLEKGATNLEVLIAAAMKQAGRGNVKAMDFLRDTAGEKPVEQLNADISGLSEEDKQMIENIKKRLESD